MFQKNSFSIPSDSSGNLLVKVIQTRRCSTTRHAKIGKFLLVVIRNTKPLLRRRRKKRKRAIVIRSNHVYFTKKGRYYFFSDNALVVLRRRMNSSGREIYGPTSKFLKIRKFRAPFKAIF